MLASFSAFVEGTDQLMGFPCGVPVVFLVMCLGSVLLLAERRDLKGLSAGIRAMQRSERALLHVPYALAYGEEGSFSFPSVPPKADLVYEVVLNGFDNPQEVRPCDCHSVTR